MDAVCPTCATPLRGRYCHACGEKRVEPGDRTVRAFLAHALEAVANLEASPGWRSLGALVARPGHLTDEHAAGRRRTYIGPVKLFLAVNVAYFFWVSWAGMNTFTTTLGTYLNDAVFRWYTRPLVEARFGELRAIPPAFFVEFQAASSRIAKSLVVLTIPLLGGVLAALHARRRRLFADHMVFATHFMAFALLLGMAIGTAMHAVARVSPARADALDNDLLLTSVMVVCMVAYLTAAFRRVYGDGPAAAVTKAVVVSTVGFLLVLTVYRMILFFPVFFTV